jgi:type VI secretion system protein ImpG
MDFEVHSVMSVTGYGTEGKREFLPFYATSHHTADKAGAYYTVQRRQRKLSERQRMMGARSSYIGSELFIALVVASEGPYRSDLKQIGLETLCTNRDLPLHLPLGQGQTDFTLDSGAPVESVRCVAGPTPPRPSHAHGDTSWRLISHLSLNYLSLTDGPDGQGASALRELLALYSDLGDAALRNQIESVVSASSRPVVRHLPFGGVLSFGRGTEVTLTCDESGFPGRAAFLFGAVIERFFAKHASINSFTETVLRSIQRGEIMRWSPRIGRTPAL